MAVSNETLAIGCS